MYEAERELGADRYGRIARMVDHHIVGRPDATAIEKVFFLANALSGGDTVAGRAEEPSPGEEETDWRVLAKKPCQLHKAYELATGEKERAFRDEGKAVLTRTAQPSVPLDDDEPPPPDEDASEIDPTASDISGVVRMM